VVTVVKVYVLEAQPNFGSGPIVGIWETIGLYYTEELARETMERMQAVYERNGTTVVMRVASRIVQR
jgi:hypothetical protein